MGKYDFNLDLYDENTICWIAEKVQTASRVLEFGPANGRLTKYLKKDKDCLIDIVEIDEESGQSAAVYAEKAFLGTDKGDIEKYYWMDTKIKYDYIVFADVLEHLVNPDEVLRRCKKILKNNGKILVSIPNISHNSVIIDLINDKFMYNPTGILDNTHLRFFTRASFEKMALSAGWAIIEERAKEIRVGETEIKNMYQDVPLNIRKELMHRPQGNIYQYLFTLAFSESYLKGEESHRVSLDSTSYYYLEAQFEYEGQLDYRHSVTRQFDPYYGNLDINVSIPENTETMLIKPINCNCILENIRLTVQSNESVRDILEYKTNGLTIEGKEFFVDDKPEIEVNLKSGENKIKIHADILKYDFEDKIFTDILNRLQFEQQHILQVCNDYEEVIKRKDKEFLQSVAVYEAEIKRREEEKKNLVAEIKQLQDEMNQMQDEMSQKKGLFTSVFEGRK